MPKKASDLGQSSNSASSAYEKETGQEKKSRAYEARIAAEEAYRAKLQANYAKKLAKATEEERAKIQEKIDKKQNRAGRVAEALGRREDLQEKYKSGAASTGEKWQLTGLNLLQGVKDSINNGFSQLKGALKQEIEGAMDQFIKASAGVTTRLLGTGKTFDELSRFVSNKLVINSVVKTSTVLEKLNGLVESGISYNIEQRAFLEAMSEKVATTFDTANGTLYKLIRLQQADTTAARMGIEASLNEFLNRKFQDTSYLSDGYDSVEAALTGAISQLSYQQGVELEYVVQKWFGSLASVGFSTDTLSSIATGLNALATGDVSSLSSNTSLMNLLAMASSRAGLPISEILTKGLSAETANTLLKGLVEYAGSLASENNQVARAQLASTFGLSMSDLVALAQLNAQDVTEISGLTKDYAGLVGTTAGLVQSAGSRTTMAEKMENVWTNFNTMLASNVANSPGAYLTWKLASMLETATGGINIPTLSTVGTFLDLETTVADLMRVGAISGGILSGLGPLISAISSGSALDINSWRGEETTARGVGFQGIAAGPIGRTTSQSVYVGGGSSDDIVNSSIARATNEATVSGMSEEDKRRQEASDKMPDNVEAILRILENGTVNVTFSRIASQYDTTFGL